MKLVIDIPEDEYNECKMQVEMMKQEGFLIESLNTALRIFVANGTPLPKGHGRIADMDEAIKCIGEVKGEDAKWAIGLIEWACDKRTIIEADRGDEE